MNNPRSSSFLHAAIVVSAFLAAAGCGRNRPQEVVAKTESAGVVEAVPVLFNPEMVVVGDPELRPGMANPFGCGPCKNESCAHERCVAARKFIADSRCEFCGRPIEWGDQIGVHFKDGTSGDRAWEDSQIDYIAHRKCTNPAMCDLCGEKISGVSASRQDGGWVHDSCLKFKQDHPELLDAINKERQKTGQ